MAEEKLTEQKKEKLRKFHMEILSSPSVSSLYATAVLNLPEEKSPIKLNFGDEGKKATYDFKYLPVLANQSQSENPDKGFARIQAKTALEAELKAQKEGVTRGAASYSAMNLFESAIGFYQSAINNVKVGDILGLMPEIETYADLTQGDLNMYMEDFQKKDKDTYNKIVSGYLISLVQIETGEAIVTSGKVTRKNLESILNEKTEKAKKQTEEQKQAA